MPFRIHELSKKWGKKSSELLDRLADLGIEAASHMTAISDENVKILAHDIVTRPKRPAKKKVVEKPEPAKTAGKKGQGAAEATAVAEAAVPAGAAQPPAVAEAPVAPAAEAAPPAQTSTGETVVSMTPVEQAPARSAEGSVQEAAAAKVAEAAKAGAKKPVVKKGPIVPEKVAAVDEVVLREQMIKAAEIAAKESVEESRILRRIILPPRKKARKKQKYPVGAEGAPARRMIIQAKPVKVELQAPVTVRGFSHATGVKTGQVMKKLMDLGGMAAMNEGIPDEMVELLGAALGVEVKVRKGYDPERELGKLEEATTDPSKLVPRAPVVTLLGHVDHGKTSLLDAIRHTDVAAGEFGGITQHIGAYRVKTDSGHTVTFLDTPGHEAFTQMRARGANVTDIVILVVAADDGVMPQTIEAINHAKAANVPIVVAVNKIDKPDAQVERVKRQLTTYELLAEEWGGQTIFVPVSAITRKGVDTLLEMLALQAEMLELSADPTRPAFGTVLEARRTEGKGIVATVLVQQGTLRPGDIMLAGGAYGKVRDITDERGRAVTEATPSTPVEVSGLGDAPDAGERFYVLDDMQKAREIAERRTSQRRQDTRVARRHVSLENLMESFAADEAKELRLILKADVQGSLEVLMHTLGDLSVPEVVVRLVHSGIGGINESDVLLADASDAIVVGFNVVAEQAARSEAERREVEIRLYNVIYGLMDEMRAALENRLEPETRENIRGHAEVRNTFKVSRLGTIAGCMVTDGVIPRKGFIKLSRQGVLVHQGQIESLKHFKDDVREVREGFECGIKIAGFDDVKIGDVLEAFETEKVARKLS